MRLQKYIADAGIASRRKAEELIKEGRVSVNGAVIDIMGYTIKDGDVVTVDGKKILKAEAKVNITLLRSPDNSEHNSSSKVFPYNALYFCFIWFI